MKKRDELLPNWDQWKAVLAATDKLERMARDGQVDLDDLLKALEQAENAFPRTVDPIDNLKEFACRQLCKSLRMVLERVEDGSDATQLH